MMRALSVRVVLPSSALQRPRQPAPRSFGYLTSRSLQCGIARPPTCHGAGAAGHTHGDHCHDEHHHHHDSDSDDDHECQVPQGGKPHQHLHHHHHGCCHGHHHDDELPDNFLTRLLRRVGVLGLVERMGHSWRVNAAAIAFFLVALALNLPALQQALPGGAPAARTVHAAALAATYALSGIPQIVEALCLTASLKIDTHVLMGFAALGTVYLGMAQEGALLLLLFRTSHLLEEQLTERAAGSLERLFAAVPSTATAVELDPTGGPDMASARVVPARGVALGAHVLIRPGDQVPLDGAVVWGSAHASLQHITGESKPVRMRPGDDLPAGED